MPNQLRIILLLLAALLPAGGARPRAQTDQFILPDDLEITLWAESPMFFNPTNNDGRADTAKTFMQDTVSGPLWTWRSSATAWSCPRRLI